MTTLKYTSSVCADTSSTSAPSTDGTWSYTAIQSTSGPTRSGGKLTGPTAATAIFLATAKVSADDNTLTFNYARCSSTNNIGAIIAVDSTHYHMFLTFGSTGLCYRYTYDGSFHQGSSVAITIGTLPHSAVMRQFSNGGTQTYTFTYNGSLLHTWADNSIGYGRLHGFYLESSSGSGPQISEIAHADTTYNGVQGTMATVGSVRIGTSYYPADNTDCINHDDIVPPSGIATGALLFMGSSSRHTPSTGGGDLALTDIWNVPPGQGSHSAPGFTRNYGQRWPWYPHSAILPGYCRYNGTAGDNPTHVCAVVDDPFCCMMTAVEPDVAGETFFTDLIMPVKSTTLSATASPTITGITTKHAKAHCFIDIQATSAVVLSAPTNGWTILAQTRNTAGSDMTYARLYKYVASPGATGDCGLTSSASVAWNYRIGSWFQRISPSSGSGSISVVQSNYTSDDGQDQTASLSSPVTSGNNVVVFFLSEFGSGNLPTPDTGNTSPVVDDKGDSDYLLINHGMCTTVTNGTWVYFKSNITSGASTFTLHLEGSEGFPGQVAVEFAGAAILGQITAHLPTSSNDYILDPLVPTGAGALGVCMFQTTGTSQTAPAWTMSLTTELQDAGGGGVTPNMGVAYQGSLSASTPVYASLVTDSAEIVGLGFLLEVITAAQAITLSGPSSGVAGNASTNFTVGADGSISGTVTVTPTSSAGTGTFTPSSVQISSGTPTATFTYTPTSIGARNINCTNNGGLNAPSNVSYTASAQTISLSGPSSGARAQASTAFTVTCDAPATANTVVTPTDSSGQGSFSPSTVTILSGNTSANSTFTYTPTTSGSRNINCTNNQGMTAPSNVAYNATAVPQATITGTVTSAQPADIVSGGKTIIITLVDDTWVTSGATFNAQRQAIINGLTAASTPTHGWNNEVRDKEVVGSVVRTSNTVVTITLSASAAYAVTATETITVTVPGAALTAGNPLVASPGFLITVQDVALPGGGGNASARGKKKRGRVIHFSDLDERARLEALASIPVKPFEEPPAAEPAQAAPTPPAQEPEEDDDELLRITVARILH